MDTKTLWMDDLVRTPQTVGITNCTRLWPRTYRTSCTCHCAPLLGRRGSCWAYCFSVTLPSMVSAVRGRSVGERAGTRDPPAGALSELCRWLTSSNPTPTHGKGRGCACRPYMSQTQSRELGRRSCAYRTEKLPSDRIEFYRRFRISGRGCMVHKCGP
jgi:hypothetical protein